MAAPALFWFRHDLRLSDNPGLAAASAGGRPVLPVFIEDGAAPWADGGAARWWLHHSLAALDRSLRRFGNRLLLLRGDPVALLPALAAEIGAEAVYCNRQEEPWALTRQDRLAEALRRQGRRLFAFHAALLFEPGSIRNRSGQNFRLFTPFWRACLQHPVEEPLDPPPALPACEPPIAGLALADLALLPRQPDWAGGLRNHWQAGEDAARARLDSFLSRTLAGYAAGRDRPDLAATSSLSPHLRFGEIGPRQILHAVRSCAAPAGDAENFLAELGWREFSYHLLAQFPGLPERCLRPEFARFPWRRDDEKLRAWQQGRTGYPLIDAGMRQLWRCGWMHNRARMATASFLVKTLLIPWQEGARWFWDTLVDADLASNSASWQWVAGCGADAAPFFRIFNPVLQGEKFDPNGAYVRRWCPELAKLPDRWLHRPFEAPAEELRRAGIRLGESYPLPLVDLKASRDRALAAFARITRG